MFVRDWMTPDPVTVSATDPIGKAREMLRIHKVRRLPVVKGTKLLSIVTDRDLRAAAPSSVDLTHSVAYQRELDDAPVRTIAPTDVVTVAPGDTIEQAASQMAARKISGLPVVEGDVLVGIITETDIFRALVEMLGLGDPGARIVLTLEPDKTTLSKELQALEARGMALTSVVTYRRRGGGPTHVVVRTSAQGAKDTKRRKRK